MLINLLNPWIVGTGTGLLATVGGTLLAPRINDRIFGAGKLANVNAGEILSKGNGDESQDLTLDGGQNVSSITDRLDPHVIRETINSHPAFQQQMIADTYIDHQVHWKVRLETFITKESPSWQLMLQPADRDYPWILANVESDKYPWLKTLR